MVIVLKNRAAIYQREAAEMLHNISLYPGLTEEQLCRFFPEKEATAKTLLAHMLKEGRIFCAENGRYYANQEAQNGADKDLSRCVWVLLDFIDQVEYHTVGEFPAAILCFANALALQVSGIPLTAVATRMSAPPKHVSAWISRAVHKLRNDESFLSSLHEN